MSLTVLFMFCGPSVKIKKKVYKLRAITETPVLGALTPQSAIVRFRTTSEATVAVEYAQNKLFTNSKETSTVDTAVADDFTGKIALNNLSANTIYWYRLHVNDAVQSSPYVQKFKTLNTESTCKMAFFGDVASRDKKTAVYRRAKDNGAILALQIGDLDHRNPMTLSEARVMHRDMKDTSKLHGAVFAKHILTKMGVVHIWDDHDYCGQDEDRFCPFRCDAWKAFKEHWPTYALPNGANGLWHSFTCGDAEVFILDTRSQRDSNASVDDMHKSMLDGAEIVNDQKDWLKTGLQGSVKTWKVVVSSVTANTSARSFSNDHWQGGFLTEAQELNNWLSSVGIDGVVMVSADLHTGGAVDDGTNNAWGIPELNVAHTNLAKGNAVNLGTWTEGVTPGTNGRNGYGLVTLSDSSIILEARGGDGAVRHSLTLVAK